MAWVGKYSVFLQNDRRFKDDPEYRRLVEISSDETVTERDIELIRSRLLNDDMGNGGTHSLSKGNILNMQYAYYSNDK